MNSRALNTQGWKEHATYFNIHLAAFLLFSIRKHFLPLVPIITALTFLSLAECRFARFWVGHSQQQNTRNRRGWLFAAWRFPAEKRTWSSDAGFRRGLSVLWLWRRRNRRRFTCEQRIVPNCYKCKMLSTWKGVTQSCCSFWAWHKFLSSVIKGNPVVTEVNSSSLCASQLGVASESSEPKRGSWLYGSCLALWLNYPTRVKHGLPWWLTR